MLRFARLDDVTRLALLNRAAYPDLAGYGVVFEEAQLAEHIRVNPAGQVVAEEDGVILGAMATLVVRSADALVQHTWSGITEHGTFSTHDPKADCLYLADIYVDPKAQGRGVGQGLYRELWAMCQRGGQRRVAAGGRLAGLHEAPATLTPGDYVAEVLRGQRKDQVLSSQLRAGFSIEGILHGYLDDWRSRSFATLLTWTNRASSSCAPGEANRGSSAVRALR